MQINFSRKRNSSLGHIFQFRRLKSTDKCQRGIRDKECKYFNPIYKLKKKNQSHESYGSLKDNKPLLYVKIMVLISPIWPNLFCRISLFFNSKTDNQSTTIIMALMGPFSFTCQNYGFDKPQWSK